MKSSWIYCSLFSEIINWGLVMKDGIKPILVKLSSTDNFRIRIDFLNGPNIQFALFTNQKECAKVAREIDLHFKSFFLHSKLYEKPTSLPFNTLFIPFPQNSIHYGLYAFDLLAEGHQSNLRSLLSEIILVSLTDNLDDSSILTLGLYLNLSIIMVYNLLPDRRPKTLHVRLLEIYPINQLSIDKAEDFVKANRNILTEILSDVSVNDFTENQSLIWLTRWQKYLKINMTKQGVKVNEYCLIVATTINEFLGFDSETVQLLNVLIHKSISSEQRFII